VIQAAAVSVSASTKTVYLISGQSISGDLIVGADGAWSTVRRCLIPETEMEGKKEWKHLRSGGPEQFFQSRADPIPSMLINGEEIKQHSELAPLLEKRHVRNDQLLEIRLK
jgi:hypothetical protein